LAALNLDFLCIHPFRDGNGPVSRLLLLLQCYHLGFAVGRYISLERLIEQNAALRILISMTIQPGNDSLILSKEIR
jgi:Fic family protein